MENNCETITGAENKTLMVALGGLDTDLLDKVIDEHYHLFYEMKAALQEAKVSLGELGFENEYQGLLDKMKNNLKELKEVVKMPAGIPTISITPFTPENFKPGNEVTITLANTKLKNEF